MPGMYGIEGGKNHVKHTLIKVLSEGGNRYSFAHFLK